MALRTHSARYVVVIRVFQVSSLDGCKVAIDALDGSDP